MIGEEKASAQIYAYSKCRRKSETPVSKESVHNGFVSKVCILHKKEKTYTTKRSDLSSVFLGDVLVVGNC